MTEIAIRVESLSKQYRLGTPTGNDRLSEMLAHLGHAVLTAPRRWLRRVRDPAPPPASTGPASFWALRDVSFEIKQGQIVGLIGRNGAGKSTLLKILSRITEPTSGRFGLRGRVGSLLEVGTGFHSELTGRENIFLSGTLLGMRSSEIRRRFDEIVAFADMDRFLDTPVKRYSSGMYVRLGFAVAAHLHPEVLIVDEVLAVGDEPFQRKCMDKLGEFTRTGGTVLLVSHSAHTVRRACTRAVWLDSGKVQMDGAAAAVLEAYAGVVPDAPVLERSELEFEADEHLPIQFRRATVEPIGAGIEDVWVRFCYEVRQPVEDAVLAVEVRDQRSICVFFANDGGWNNPDKRRIGPHECRLQIPLSLLAPGPYKVSFGFQRHEGTPDALATTSLTVFRPSFLCHATHHATWPSVLCVPSRWSGESTVAEGALGEERPGEGKEVQCEETN